MNHWKFLAGKLRNWGVLTLALALVGPPAAMLAMPNPHAGALVIKPRLALDEVPDATATADPWETPTESPTEEPTWTPEPTWEPTWEPTPEPTWEPTWEPTPEPTWEPTPEPTWEPTPEPTWEPTPEPTWEPTPEPTWEPTPEPTWTPEPTPEPTWEPTPEPTWTPEPTPEPTWEPTPEPTWTPEPTPEPTWEPTPEPTWTPEPTPEPTATETPTPTPTPTCEPKPKDWSTGDAIKVTAYSPKDQVIVCLNESVSISVTATDKDHWEIRCKADNKLDSEGDADDELKYSWAGGGTFTDDKAASTTWKSDKAGDFTLTCTIDDKPTAVVAPETGTRDDSAVTQSVKVCVVDPGTAPKEVKSVTYTENKKEPWSDDWGATKPSQPDVDAEASFDCTTKKWKGVVTKAEGKYDIFYRLIKDCNEANLADATEANYCEMIKNLQSLKGPKWYMVAAVEAHERVHVASYKRIVDKHFATAKAAIEALTVDHTCGKTAAQATADLKALAAYTKAINDMKANIATDWTAQIALDHAAGGPCDKAEQGVVNPRIDEIKKKATDNKWAPCP
jgi:hypothetical protein